MREQKVMGMASNMKTSEDLILHWEKKFLNYLQEHWTGSSDGSHDLGHFQRVWTCAKQIADEELIRNAECCADTEVLLAAAYFHDFNSKSKDDPEASSSSLHSAKAAGAALKEMGFPHQKIEAVKHAIHAHSFSANILPQTIEAKIIQDADRMEAIGALGVARTFYVSGLIGSLSYDVNDPLANNRPLDDKKFALDHFFTKLLKLQDAMQTDAGRRLAKERSAFLSDFAMRLAAEIKGKDIQPFGAIYISEIFHRAGKQRIKLFQSSDPLARDRSLEPFYYALDELLLTKIEQEDSVDFLQYFVEQIAEDLQIL